LSGEVRDERLASRRIGAQAGDPLARRLAFVSVEALEQDAAGLDFRVRADGRAAAERATLLFSAKEAFYKAQYCVSQTFVGFHEAELRFDEHGQFEVTLQGDVGTFFRAGSAFHGRYALLDAHVVTGLVIAPR